MHDEYVWENRMFPGQKQIGGDVRLQQLNYPLAIIRGSSVRIESDSLQTASWPFRGAVPLAWNQVPSPLFLLPTH